MNTDSICGAAIGLENGHTFAYGMQGNPSNVHSTYPSTSSSMSAMNSINKNWANFNNDVAKSLDTKEAERHQNCDYGPSNHC